MCRPNGKGRGQEGVLSDVVTKSFILPGLKSVFLQTSILDMHHDMPLTQAGLSSTLEVCSGITDPTHTRYGSGRRVDVSWVGSGTATTSRGTGILGFTRKEHNFSRLWSENLLISACFLNYLR